MKRSRLSWLGFLGFLGLLGLVTGKVGMYGFFGFFGFFAFRSIVHDERLDATVAAAGRNAFFAGLAIFVVTSLSVSFLTVSAARVLAGYAFAATYAIQMLVFVVSLIHYDRVGAVA
ncbi:MAG: DUF3796 domain-containing protein [Coriobacteriia bacterium]|nr:DUF3796 domain-containing protein [Coriobacteriia bacterium]